MIQVIPSALTSVCAARQYGCLVVNAPTANTIAAAEHGIAMLCALTRNVAQADASVKRGEWKRTKYVGVSLVGKTLAIMGFGKVRPWGVGTALGFRNRSGLDFYSIFQTLIAGNLRSGSRTASLVGFGKVSAKGSGPLQGPAQSHQ